MGQLWASEVGNEQWQQIVSVATMPYAITAAIPFELVFKALKF